MESRAIAFGRNQIVQGKIVRLNRRVRLCACEDFSERDQVGKGTIVRASGFHAGCGCVRYYNEADGEKCERCWHWEADVGSNAEHPTLCGCCVEAVNQFKG